MSDASGLRDQSGRESPYVLAAVFLAGAGTMIVELAAVRLLAPWFGASNGVWTNVIGVILFALALGYVLGGRLSHSASPVRRLGWILLCAGAWTLALPHWAGTVAELLMPSGLGLDEAGPLLLWGSLAASVTLFAPVATLLGCGCPLAVEALQQSRGGHAGEAGGRILGFSTLGSLVGTFGTTHWLLPQLGLSGTFHLAAAFLTLAGAWLVVRSGGIVGPLGALALCAFITFTQEAPAGPSLQSGWRILAQRQSSYQNLTVIENEAGTRRHLLANEGLDSFQSVWQPEQGLLGGGQYYDYFALPCWWSGKPGTWRTLVLGLGAGTTIRVLEGASPKDTTLSTTGIEVDEVVVQLGSLYFDLQAQSPNRTVHAGVDGRVGLRFIEESQDLVVVDCYANNMEIPAHLCTVEFFKEIGAVLSPGGWIAVNAAGFGLEDPVVRALAQTLAEATQQEVLAVRIPFSRNCMLFGRLGQPLPKPGTQEFQFGGPVGEALLPFIDFPGAFALIAPGAQRGTLLTDDDCPMEALQRSSLQYSQDRWEADR